MKKNYFGILFPGENFWEKIKNEARDFFITGEHRKEFLIMGAYSFVLLFYVIIQEKKGFFVDASWKINGAFLLLGGYFFISDMLKRKKILAQAEQFFLDAFFYSAFMGILIAVTGGHASPIAHPLVFLMAMSAPIYGTMTQSIVFLFSVLSVYLLFISSGEKVFSVMTMFYFSLDLLALFSATMIIKLSMLSLEEKESENRRLYEKQIEANREIRMQNRNLEKVVDEKTKALAEKLNDASKHNKILEDSKVAMINILDDVQFEKRKSERLSKDLEKFQLAVAGASDHIVITDTEGIILYMNKAAELITGYSIKYSVGKKAGSKELWGGNMVGDFYEKLWRTIKKEKKIFSGEVLNTRRNGEKYEAFASISPILGDDGAVRFFVGIERDITKTKQVDRAKTEFVSLASHQLRTPLTAIKWNAEIVLEEKMSEEIRGYIQQIYQSNERMVELVNGLLNVSRIDMGTFAVDPKSVDPLEIIDSVVNELESLVVSKKLIISKKYEKKIGLLETDQKLLRIVLQNLLSNAVKYTNEKGEVFVSVKKDGNILKFSIKDSGIGIPKNQQERIFSKLFRAENAVASVSDGTGLGLYVSKAVVEQLGGKIGFKSQENKGTTFFFNLPVGGVEKKDGNKELTAM